jgi:selenocysteine lyase/cysteine desulfurase
VGVPSIEQHVLALARVFTTGLLELGLPVMSGKVDRHFSHVVIVGSAAPDAALQARLQSVYDHLAANRVKLSIRHGRLRFAFHFYNTLDEVEKVLALLRARLAKTPEESSDQALNRSP